MKKGIGVIFACMLGIILLGSSTSWSQSKSPAQYKFKFHTWESMGSLHWEPNYVAFKKAVEQKSNGRVVIDLQAGGTMGAHVEGLNLVRSGMAEIGYVADDYHQEELPLSQVWLLPAPYTAGQKAVWFRQLYKEFFAEQDAKQNLVQIGYWPLAQYGLFTRSKKIYKIADIKGLSVRTPNAINTEAYKNLGALPVSLPFSETIQAVEKGVVDAVACAPLHFSIYKLHEAGKPGHFHDIGGGPSGCSTFKMNKKVFDGLPKDLQEIILDAGWEYMGKDYCRVCDDADIEGLKLIVKHGGEVISFSAAEKERMKKEILEPLWESFAKKTNAKGLPGSKVAAAVKALWPK